MRGCIHRGRLLASSKKHGGVNSNILTDSRKGYSGLVAELRENKVIADDEEVDRFVLWRKAREVKAGKIVDGEVAEIAVKIEDLLEKQSKGEFQVSGKSDVLSSALGSSDHYGWVRGVGGFVKPHVYFKTPRRKQGSLQKEVVNSLKENVEETKNLKDEVAKLKAHFAQLSAMNISSPNAASSKQSSNHVKVMVCEEEA